MIVADVAPDVVLAQIRGSGLQVGMGPFTVRIQSDIPDVVTHLPTMYAHHPHRAGVEFADFHVQIRRRKGLRRWIRSQALFLLDDEVPFRPLPIEQAFPMLEWGLNWCISNFAHQYLIVHAGVVERHGLAAVLPGQPGAGKSTLCAGLVNRGWRLLSDELALFCLRTGRLVPLARPVNIKNESIALIRNFAPQAVLTRPFSDTAKGTVALMRPPEDSALRSSEPARPAWIIAPSYRAGSGCRLQETDKGHAFIKLVDLSFNYSLLGSEGFVFLADLVDELPSFELTYSDLDSAIAEFDNLAASAAG